MLVIVITSSMSPGCLPSLNPPNSPGGSKTRGIDSLIQEGKVGLSRVSRLLGFSQVLPEEGRTRKQLLKHLCIPKIAGVC